MKTVSLVHQISSYPISKRSLQEKTSTRRWIKFFVKPKTSHGKIAFIRSTGQFVLLVSGNFLGVTRVRHFSYLLPTMLLRKKTTCNYLSSEPRFINNLSSRQEKSRICPKINPRGSSLGRITVYWTFFSFFSSLKKSTKRI